jgi:hypothetical protein
MPGRDDRAGFDDAVAGLTDAHRADYRALLGYAWARAGPAGTAREQSEDIHGCQAGELARRASTGKHLRDGLGKPLGARSRIGERRAVRARRTRRNPASGRGAPKMDDRARWAGPGSLREAWRRQAGLTVRRAQWDREGGDDRQAGAPESTVRRRLGSMSHRDNRRTVPP